MQNESQPAGDLPNQNQPNEEVDVDAEEPGHQADMELTPNPQRVREQRWKKWRNLNPQQPDEMAQSVLQSPKPAPVERERRSERIRLRKQRIPSPSPSESDKDEHVRSTSAVSAQPATASGSLQQTPSSPIVHSRNELKARNSGERGATTVLEAQSDASDTSDTVDFTSDAPLVIKRKRTLYEMDPNAHDESKQRAKARKLDDGSREQRRETRRQLQAKEEKCRREEIAKQKHSQDQDKSRKDRDSSFWIAVILIVLEFSISEGFLIQQQVYYEALIYLKRKSPPAGSLSMLEISQNPPRCHRPIPTTHWRTHNSQQTQKYCWLCA